MLKKYIYEIFEIAMANDQTVDAGLDMFTTNLDRLPGAHFFEGAVGLDYAPLYEQWAALDKAARAKARREVTGLVPCPL